MINNRQGGRRRGRGGQQPRGVASNSSSGNRQDNRQRGNAAQLHEKYKSMARDSQLAGDRVQTEYYLQFADHYFRMLGDARPRFDEQKRQQGDDDVDDDRNDRMDSDMDNDGDGDLDGDNDEQPQQQQRTQSDEQSQQRSSRPRPNNDRSEPRRDRPNGRVRDDGNRNYSRDSASQDDGDERIDFAVLPPAIGIDEDLTSPAEAEAEQAPRPRRVRRPRADEGDANPS